MNVIYPYGQALAALLLLAGCGPAPVTGSPETGDQSATTDAGLISREADEAGDSTGDNAVLPNGTGLCAAGEPVLFSCQLDNRNLVSICGARNGAGNPVAQYRYGKAGQVPELTWPEAGSADRLKFASVPYSGGGEAQLHFRRGDTQYVVYSRVIRTNFTAGEPNDPALEDGIVVRKGEKIIARHSCADPKLVPIDYEKAELYAETSADDIVELEY